MKSTRARIIFSEAGAFLRRNKKLVVCFSLLFLLGIIIGIIATINSYGGQFERVARTDMTFGAVKVFFFGALYLAGGYFVILLASLSNKVYFIAIIPFVLIGLIFGRYMCLLIALYASIGILNLLLCYLPFFLLSFACMLVGAVTALSEFGCSDKNSLGLRPQLIKILKAYLVNLIICFVLFLLIGAMVDVVIVSG